jgi:hypothetical protein
MRWNDPSQSTAARLMAQDRPVGLYAFVRADSWVPVWIQVCWLWCRRVVGKL